jgi:hypothetical protein
MRRDHGDVEAVHRLMPTLASGFNRMLKLRLLEWTVEAAVLLFPECGFIDEDRTCADFKLRAACEGTLRSLIAGRSEVMGTSGIRLDKFQTFEVGRGRWPGSKMPIRAGGPPPYRERITG